MRGALTSGIDRVPVGVLEVGKPIERVVALLDDSALEPRLARRPVTPKLQIERVEARAGRPQTGVADEAVERLRQLGIA